MMGGFKKFLEEKGYVDHQDCLGNPIHKEAIYQEDLGCWEWENGGREFYKINYENRFQPSVNDAIKDAKEFLSSNLYACDDYPAPEMVVKADRFLRALDLMGRTWVEERLKELEK